MVDSALAQPQSEYDADQPERDPVATAEPDMIPDPEALAAYLGVGTVVLIVGNQRTFLVALTGCPETQARLVEAYRQAGLPMRVVVGVALTGRPHQAA